MSQIVFIIMICLINMKIQFELNAAMQIFIYYNKIKSHA